MIRIPYNKMKYEHKVVRHVWDFDFLNLAQFFL